MTWVPELRGVVYRGLDGEVASFWEVSRRFRRGVYWVSEFGVWGSPTWLKDSKTYSAVVDDFGDLVRVSA